MNVCLHFDNNKKFFLSRPYLYTELSCTVFVVFKATHDFVFTLTQRHGGNHLLNEDTNAQLHEILSLYQLSDLSALINGHEL